MKHPRLLARCLEPVAMTEEALRVCLAVVSDDRWFADERARARAAAGALDGRRALAVSGGVATIAVEGPLVRKASMFSEVSALTSYDAVRADLRAAMSDPSVRSIDWAFDSPGGEVSGLFELADEIHAARGMKPMRALVADASSAAYVLAAAVGNIEIEQAGTAGSVGVRMGVARRDGDEERIEFVSTDAPLKVADPSSDTGRAMYQERVDQLHALMVEKIAAYRGVSPEKVRADYGRGAWLVGAHAVAAGLADRVGISRGANRMDPTIVGLTADADAAAVESQARALIAFRDQVCSALGCGSAAEAVGKVTAAAEALAERDALRSALAAAEQSARADRLRSALTAAVDEKRLTLGELARVVPSLYGAGRAAAVEAVGKVEKQEASALVGALVGVPLSAEAVDSVTAYIDAKAPASLPSPVGAPAIPAGAAEAVAAELDKTTDTIRKAGAAARAALGLNPA